PEAGPDRGDRVVPEQQVASEEHPSQKRQANGPCGQPSESAVLEPGDEPQQRKSEESPGDRPRRGGHGRPPVKDPAERDAGRANQCREPGSGGEGGEQGRKVGARACVAHASPFGTGRDHRSRVRTRSNPSDSYNSSAPSFRPFTAIPTSGAPAPRRYSDP